MEKASLLFLYPSRLQAEKLQPTSLGSLVAFEPRRHPSEANVHLGRNTEHWGSSSFKSSALQFFPTKQAHHTSSSARIPEEPNLPQNSLESRMNKTKLFLQTLDFIQHIKDIMLLATFIYPRLKMYLRASCIKTYSKTKSKNETHSLTSFNCCTEFKRKYISDFI